MSDIVIHPGENQQVKASEIGNPLFHSKVVQSEQIDQVLPAFGRAWGKYDKLNRSATGQVYKEGRHVYDWKYATLDDVYEAVQKHLVEEGLFVMHRVVQLPDQPGDYLLTQIWHHNSLQWIGQWQSLVRSENAQSWGSQLTYKMRYGLCAMLGIVPADDDDDANAASGQQMHRNDRSRDAQPSQPPAGQAKPAKQPPKQPPPSNQNAAAGVIVPPPTEEAIESRVHGLESPAAIKEWLDKIPGYNAMTHNPEAWPHLMGCVVDRLDRGHGNENWDPEEADSAEQHMNDMWLLAAKSAIDSLATPETLLRWARRYRKDYWQGEHEQFRDPTQWREVILHMLKRSAEGVTNSGWQPTATNVLAEEIKQHQSAVADVEAQLAEPEENDHAVEEPAAEPSSESEANYTGTYSPDPNDPTSGPDEGDAIAADLP